MKWPWFCILLGVLPLGAAEVPSVETDKGRGLTDWLVLGPWTVPIGEVETALETDFLEMLGARETTKEAVVFAQLAPQQKHLIRDQEWLDFSTALERSPAFGVEATVGYALCLLHAEEAGEAWLLLGSDMPVAVWLNGERVHIQRKERALQTYNDAVRLALLPGDNLLLIKAVSKGGWSPRTQARLLTARLEPSLGEAVQTLLSLNYSFFEQSLVAPGQPLELYLRGMPESAQFEGIIERYDGTPVRAAVIGLGHPIPTEGLGAGLYRFSRHSDGAWAKPVFYVGTYAGLYESMRERVEAAGAAQDDRTRINLAAYLRRLEVLRDAVRAAGDAVGQPKSLVYDADHKAIYAASALEEVLGNLARGEEPFRNRTGLHLRGFRSKIDDQPMYYRLFVPSSYRIDSPEGAPLFIIVQTPLQVGRPFLESVFVANQRDAEMWARMAESLGIILLWPGYRVSPYQNPIDFAHYEEVLAAVRADYRIDPARIYLQGFCGSALFSAMEVRRHPRRYAALAMVNPVLHRLKGRLDERVEFRAFEDYWAWLRETDPLAHCESLAGTPIQILHDEVDPDHGPLSDSVELVNALHAVDAEIEFVRQRPEPWSVREKLFERQLAWACQQRRTDPSEELGVAASAEPLSVAAVLSERFIVVRGTGGSDEERAAAARWCAEFCAAWKRTAFTDCRVVDDVALTGEERRTSNLVLMGSPTSNREWQRLESLLPLKMTRGQIAVSGETYTGSSLGVQVAFPNPEQATHKVLLIGSAASEADFGTMELALDGWFSYAIWEASTLASRARLRAAVRSAALRG